MADHRSTNVTWHAGHVDAAQRAAHLGQRGAVLWLTGLSGSGKSTLAAALERDLLDDGRVAYVLDGDNVRHGLCGDLGFGAADRTENIRRIGHVAQLFADAGVIAIAAFISPFAADRNRARALLPREQFFEIHVATPLEICESRDPKGLYARARRGELADLTGVSAPYEPPQRPDLTVDTAMETVGQCVSRIRALLEPLLMTQ